MGLLENVRVRRAGFAYRQEYWRFLRYPSTEHLNIKTQTVTIGSTLPNITICDEC